MPTDNPVSPTDMKAVEELIAASPVGLTDEVLQELATREEICDEDCEPFHHYDDEGEGDEFCAAWDSGCRFYEFCTAETDSIINRLAKYIQLIKAALPALRRVLTSYRPTTEQIREALERLAEKDDTIFTWWAEKRFDEIAALLTAELGVPAARTFTVDEVVRLRDRVKELEFEPLSMHCQYQAKQGEADLWEKRYNQAIEYIKGVWNYLEKLEMERAMRVVFEQGMREMEECLLSAIALAISFDTSLLPKGGANDGI